MKEIRILHCLCRVGSGGVEQRFEMLTSLLPPGRYIHEVICQDSFGVIPTQLDQWGVPMHEIGLARHILNPAWYARALLIARRFQPDIIHGAVFEGNALANVVGTVLPRARVISEETSDPRGRKTRADMLLRFLFKRSSAVIGVSPFVTDYLRTTLKVSENKIRLINNGIADPPPTDAAALARLRQRFGITDADLLIGSVGRLDDNHKRFSDVIRALPTIRESEPRARLLIVGEGGDRSALEELAISCAVRDAVIFTGYRGDARALYGLMDMFVLASAEEAFGMVLVEAMMAGVPIVATAVGGIPFVLNRGECGVLVAPQQPAALARAVIALWKDQGRRERLSAAGLRRAHEKFSASRYVKELDDLYQQLMRETV